MISRAIVDTYSFLHLAKHLRDRVRLLSWEFRLIRISRPSIESTLDFADNLLRPAYIGSFGHLDEIVHGKSVSLSVAAHLLFVDPPRVSLICEYDVMCRGEGPGSVGIHEKRMILRVIVLVASEDVENHSPVQFLQRILCEL